tara:strand:- start:489 stop:680 length:192 start_codon:yes stop_codon:yes gene_type:complete
MEKQSLLPFLHPSESLTLMPKLNSRSLTIWDGLVISTTGFLTGHPPGGGGDGGGDGGGGGIVE